MEEESEIKTYSQGVEAGKNDFQKKFEREGCLELYKEGYKSGYRDGFKAAMEEFKERMISQMPSDMKKQMDEGAQPIGWPFIW